MLPRSLKKTRANEGNFGMLHTCSLAVKILVQSAGEVSSCLLPPCCHTSFVSLELLQNVLLSLWFDVCFLDRLVLARVVGLLFCSRFLHRLDLFGRVNLVVRGHVRE